MIQIGALLVDAYRDLNHRKMFWLTMLISLVVVVAYASIGFTDTGISNFFGLWVVENEALSKGSPYARALYLGIFSDFVVGIWLSWIAAILALISTAGIFPEMLSGGSIDLLLSKPISRLRLFIYKYLSSLLFVVLQVSVFCAGVFLCVGWRLGEWNWKIFLGVPLVTLFFSYIYCVCVMLGVFTRSTIATLLLTLLFWFSVFSVSTTENILSSFKHRFDVQLERMDASREKLEATLGELTGEDESIQTRRQILTTQIEDLASSRQELAETTSTLRPWHTWTRMASRILPRTEATVALLSRSLRQDDGISILSILRGEMPGARNSMRTMDPDGYEATVRMEAEQDSEPWWWVIGTSLLFEGVVLAIAAWVFCRRDY